MAWIDYKKAFDMVPYPWLKECLKLVKVEKVVAGFHSKSMGKWITVLECEGKTFAKVNIRRGIFRGDSLSPCYLLWL